MPKPPVIPSMAGAVDSFAIWLRENRYHQVVDDAGLTWQLKVEGKELPAEDDPHKSVWKVAVWAEVTVTPADLVKTGTLDASADARLLGLLDGRPIAIKMKPKALTADRLESIRHLISSEVNELRVKIERHAFHDVKKELVGRWLEERMTFEEPRE